MNNKKRGSLPLAALCMLFAVLVIAVIPTDAEAAIYDDTLRVHILASSDSEADQALKLTVRDKILEKYSTALSGSENIDEAVARIEELLPTILSDAREWVAEEGYSYEVNGVVTREWYDTRVYEDFTLPKGYYASLKITLGEGAGKNWWCVMFPPLCLDIATDGAPSADSEGGYSDAETRLIGKGKYSVKFKILELASEALRQISKRG
ncbi:MAG: stage II sporulation protein R [Clostridia bacterium]|nr:stage II sporulation protein R [Clostridia bacterium]